MSTLDPSKIRNVAILGHIYSGKTSLVESIAYRANAIQTKGSIEKKNTISDYLEDEKKKSSSLSTSIVSINYNDYKINLLDIPGNDDYISEALSVTRLIKGAVLVIDASSGVQIGTIKHFNLLKKRGVPIFIYVNKMDKENVDFPSLFEEIRTKLGGKKCVPFTYPIGKKDSFDGFVNVVELKARRYNGQTCVDDVVHDDKKEIIMELHNTLVEAVATTSDALLDKFFAGETLTIEEIKEGLRVGVLKGELYPVLVGSALKDIGSHTLLKMMIDYLPSPVDLKPYVATDKQNKEIEIKTDTNEPTSLYIFKNVYDPYQGLVSYFKVNSGVVKVGDELACLNNNTTCKISSLFSCFGSKFTSQTELCAGDIGCTTRLENIKTAYTLSNMKNPIMYKPVHYPSATYFKAIVCKSKKDSDKLFPSLEKIILEDPCVVLKENPTTNQILVGGLGLSHLQYVFEKLKDAYKIEFTLEEPKIVYKETITKSAEAEGRYVKQSGGAGYYGVVNMVYEPAEKTEFESRMYGGHVDKGYIPAIEKGFYEALNCGLLANSPVINVKAILVDGKQHSVDSNELAFKNASIAAFKEAYMKCGPILLEPYDKITVNISNDYLGSVLSDLSKRRGRILETTEDETGNLNVVAVVPESSIVEYANELKALTKGTGYFNLQFDSYERVPEALAEKIILSIKK